jgi:hypothetical protein
MRPVELSNYARIAWGLTLVLQIGLLVMLFARGHRKRLPFFCAYISLNVLQGLFLAIVYPRLDSHAMWVWRGAWISQGLVIVARASAIGELGHKIMAAFRGIWGLAWRALAACGLVVLAVSILFGKHNFMVLVLTLDQGVELAIAVVSVGFFWFASYYDLEISEPFRSLGIGFCLYSCIFVVNDAILQRLMKGYSGTWNLVGTLAFAASVTLWLRASMKRAPAPANEPRLLNARVYQAVMPEMNRRLVALNEELSRVWRVERRST